MSKVAIVYATNRGNAKTVAEKLKERIKDADVFNIKDIDVADLNSYGYLILGTSSIGHGDILKPWAEKLDNLSKLDFTGKKVALFGLGSALRHGDTFSGGMSHLYDTLIGKVAIEGATSTNGYTYESSKSVVEDKFVGLVIDQDNEGDKTDARIDAWLKTLSV